MSETTINQRLIFLMDALKMKAGPFSRALGLSETTVRNYVDRNSKPSSDVLEKIYYTFDHVNLVWLVTGEGQPFKEGSAPTQNQTNISGKKSAVNVASGNGTATTNNYNLTDCEKERDGYKAQLDKAQREIELLTGQLELKDTIIKGKDEMLDLLRGGFNRPN